MSNELRAVAREVHCGRFDAAERLLSVLLCDLEGRRDSMAIQSRVFAGALAKTLSQSADERANLYLRDYEVPQIKLFDLLASRVPVVSWARQLGTALLADLCRGEREVTLIDIGIGLGSQEVALLYQLARAPNSPKRLTIVAIECQAGSLDEAERALERAGEETGIELSLLKLAVPVEELSERDWSRIERQPGCKIAVSSFAMHHVRRNEGAETRDHVLSRLARLGVKGFVLTEPDSDHLNDDYLARFDAAWQHFGAVFRMLDDLDLGETERNALKVSFFGREIADILGTVHGSRSERHEPTEHWWNRLTRAGFVPQRARMPHSMPRERGLETVDRGKHLSIEHRGVGIVSVMCGVPRQARHRTVSSTSRALVESSWSNGPCKQLLNRLPSSGAVTAYAAREQGTGEAQDSLPFTRRERLASPPLTGSNGRWE